MKTKFLVAIQAFIFSTITIGLISFISINSNYSLLLGSFGATMVLIFGFPKIPFSQPKNIFFGHFITSLVGITTNTYLLIPSFLIIAISVGLGIFFMIILDVTHPPAGGNAIIIVLIGDVTYSFLVFPIITGTLLIILLGIIFNRLLKKKYPYN